MKSCQNGSNRLLRDTFYGMVGGVLGTLADFMKGLEKPQREIKTVIHLT